MEPINKALFQKIFLEKAMKEARERTRKEMIALARELSERGEVFPFPGIDLRVYKNRRAGEEAYPGYSTPIDELLRRFRMEGMKVVLGAHPESGNIYILPAQSNDIENDQLIPRQLYIDERMDPRLKRLILLGLDWQKEVS